MSPGLEIPSGVPPGEKPPPIEPVLPNFLKKACQSLQETTGQDLFGGLGEKLAAFVDEKIIKKIGQQLEKADVPRLMETIRGFTDVSQLYELFGEGVVDFLSRIVGELEDLPQKQLANLVNKLGLEIPIEPGE